MINNKWIWRITTVNWNFLSMVFFQYFFSCLLIIILQTFLESSSNLLFLEFLLKSLTTDLEICRVLQILFIIPLQCSSPGYILYSFFQFLSLYFSFFYIFMFYTYFSVSVFFFHFVHSMSLYFRWFIFRCFELLIAFSISFFIFSFRSEWNERSK